MTSEKGPVAGGLEQLNISLVRELTRVADALEYHAYLDFHILCLENRELALPPDDELIEPSRRLASYKLGASLLGKIVPPSFEEGIKGRELIRKLHQRAMEKKAEQKTKEFSGDLERAVEAVKSGPEELLPAARTTLLRAASRRGGEIAADRLKAESKDTPKSAQIGRPIDVAEGNDGDS